MLGILLYCIGVMYTPGPVNILSLNRGMQYRFTAHVPFCLGVGAALCFWFTLVGYAGSAVLGDHAMPFISALGVAFILYLAWKIISSDATIERADDGAAVLTFRDGLLMQLLNPKSFLAVLPVTTIQFPAAGIDGPAIALWSVGLSALGFGAPLSYAVIGSKVSAFVTNRRFLKCFNVVMGAMLAVVAVDMAYEHVFLAIW